MTKGILFRLAGNKRKALRTVRNYSLFFSRTNLKIYCHYYRTKFDNGISRRIYCSKKAKYKVWFEKNNIFYIAYLCPYHKEFLVKNESN